VGQTAGADLRGIPWYASALAISWPVDAMEREAAQSLQRAGPGMMEMREAMAMSPVVALPDQRQARRSARQELVRQVELGATASEARRRCPVPMHRTTVYRLLKRVGQEGEQAFSERRHGHRSNCVERCSPGFWTIARATRLFPVRNSSTSSPNDSISR
jgi:hypothetical protein